MSIEVPIGELGEVAAARGPAAYVVAAGGSGAPRVTHCAVELVDGMVVVELGRSACREIALNPDVTVVWPATTDHPMSLIVDGRVGDRPPGDGGRVVITPLHAVRHRPAPL